MAHSSKGIQTTPSQSQRDSAKEHIKELIYGGKLPKEGYLPSIRDTAELIGYNRDAVWRAYLDLEAEAIVVSTSNKRYKIHPSVLSSRLRDLNIRLVTVGEGSIRFAGLQRFHKTLTDNEKQYGVKVHLECVVDANAIEQSWFEGMDGLVLAGYFEKSELLNSIANDIPRLGIITSQQWNPDVAIDSDNQLAGKLAAEHLIEQGVQSPCILSYDLPTNRADLRKLGFQTKWVESGRSLNQIREVQINPSNNYQRVIELENRSREFVDHDAVFCVGKESAIDLLNILDHRRVKVPESLKVIGVDGAFEGLQTKPTLTYVKQDFETMASICVEKMRELCSLSTSDLKKRQSEKITVAPNLVIRESA